MFKRLICKLKGKHSYEFGGASWEYIGKYRVKIHIRRCKSCGHEKKIAV